MTTESIRMPPDPRRFGDGAHPWLKLSAAELRPLLRDACAQQRDAEIAAALQSAPSAAAYTMLWNALCDSVHQAAGDGAAGALMARIFALPLIIVTGSRKRLQLDGALPDIGALKELFLQKGVLGKTQNFGMGNALCSLETIESLRPAEVFAWTQAGGATRRDLPPQALLMEEPGEMVHLRFLVGAGIAPANEPPLTETASNIGAWGMALTRLLSQQLAQAGAEVLPMARPPADLLRAAHIGRTAQLEAACNLFASNAVRRFRTASGDPVAIISAHDNGELRLTLSQPFDEQMVEGFRWPLHPLDDIAVITAVMNELLSACRVAQIEIAPGVLPDLNPAGTPWFPGLREWRSISTH